MGGLRASIELKASFSFLPNLMAHFVISRSPILLETV